MSSRTVVKPAAGRLVRVPGTHTPLPAEGLPMEIDSYWIRKELAGDVTFETESQSDKKEGK